MQALPQIIWIEDDLRYAKLLELELGHRFQFHVVKGLDSIPPELIISLRSGAIEAVLIDMHLSEGRQGPEGFQKLRDLGFDGPIFVLSNDESSSSKLEMLSLGVDDYLWKVMPTQELELRLSNSIRRYRERFKRTLEKTIGLEGFEIDFERISGSLHGAPVALSKIEFKICLSLLRSHPQPVKLEVLKREAWGQAVVEIGTIGTFLWKLNKKVQGWSFRIVRAGDDVGLHRG